MISNLDSYLSAIQLGITVTSLILGWLGEPTVQVLLNPILEKFIFRRPFLALFRLLFPLPLLLFLMLY